jgi:hypothetical protein
MCDCSAASKLESFVRSNKMIYPDMDSSETGVYA